MAATELSTPPDRPQMTLPSPTCSRISRDLGLAVVGHRPVARQPADMAHEIGNQLAAIGRVDDFGVELRAVEFAFLVGDHREGRAVAGGDDLEPGAKRVTLSPWLIQT